jgi:hypothetical protein
MIEPCRKYFAGEFQKLFDEYEAGYVIEQHCPCHFCVLRCDELELPRCIKSECEGCKNLASGKKIRNYEEDLLRDC